MNSSPTFVAPLKAEALSDEACMEAFVSGDAAAFDLLFERHARNMLRYLRRMVASDALAEELCQSTFLSLILAKERYLPGKPFKPWLYAIASNAARDSLRRRGKETLTDDGTLPEIGFEPHFTSDPGVDRQVRAALSQLPENQRETIVLHRFEELEFAEVALVLGISESAAKVRAHRGYERLRELLRNVWEQL